MPTVVTCVSGTALWARKRRWNAFSETAPIRSGLCSVVRAFSVGPTTQRAGSH
ncbi:hypothetical protein [Streptomyces sp. NPDC055013]